MREVPNRRELDEIEHRFGLLWHVPIVLLSRVAAHSSALHSAWTLFEALWFAQVVQKSPSSSSIGACLVLYL